MLLGLIDLCLEHSTASGAPPTMVTTAQLARKVTALYWSHVEPFRERAPLVQNTTGQIEILRLIERCRAELPHGSLSLARERVRHPAAIAQLERGVEWKLVQMPLPRLQVLGDRLEPFIYRIEWDTKLRKGDFDSPDFINAIRFLPDAAEHLVRLVPLIRPLIQRRWAEMVAKLNGLEESRLEEHLFGATRESLIELRAPLIELQSGACLYCSAPLRGGVEVDHFIPWSRHPDNALDNLVAAHSACNNAKRDFLADGHHVDAWMNRNAVRSAALDEIAAERKWDRNAEATQSTARSVYLRLPADTRLWREGRTFVPADRNLLRRALKAA